MTPEIILASGSKNRQALLREIGVPFRAVLSDFDEESISGTPLTKVLTLAREKAKSVGKTNPGIIISGDTFTVFEDRDFQKPKDLEEARSMLRELRGKQIIALTGVSVLNTYTGGHTVVHRTTPVEVMDISDAEIEEYITSNPVTDWAACYNPLIEQSQKIFHPLTPYRYGLQYGLSIDVIRDELRKIGREVDISSYE